MADAGSNGLADIAREASERDTKVAIRQALGLLPAGKSSGRCADCGRRIEKPRLTLLPGTAQCAACAQKRNRLAAPVEN